MESAISYPLGMRYHFSCQPFCSDSSLNAFVCMAELRDTLLSTTDAIGTLSYPHRVASSSQLVLCCNHTVLGTDQRGHFANFSSSARESSHPRSCVSSSLSFTPGASCGTEPNQKSIGPVQSLSFDPGIAASCRNCHPIPVSVLGHVCPVSRHMAWSSSFKR